MPLLGGPSRGRQHADARSRQAVRRAADALLLLLDHAMGALADGRQLRGGGHARGIAAAHAFRPGAHQAGHADQEELVQVGTDDGQELDAFQQRHVVGQPLAEDAVVELQPAQLAVEVHVVGTKRVLSHNQASSRRTFIP